MATFELILVARHLLPSIGVFISFNEALCTVMLRGNVCSDSPTALAISSTLMVPP
jgi:hypothetical protein